MAINSCNLQFDFKFYFTYYTYKSSLSTSRVNCILPIEMIISIAKLMM